jgi:hypothetical protein
MRILCYSSHFYSFYFIDFIKNFWSLFASASSLFTINLIAYNSYFISSFISDNYSDLTFYSLDTWGSFMLPFNHSIFIFKLSDSLTIFSMFRILFRIPQNQNSYISIKKFIQFIPTWHLTMISQWHHNHIRILINNTILISQISVIEYACVRMQFLYSRSACYNLCKTLLISSYFRG